jgi:hypothetical protein
VILGLVQDGERFVVKRGLMVDLQHFDPEETFVSLEETIHNLVAEHGPIAVPEIVQRMAEERKVHDAGIALIGLVGTGAPRSLGLGGFRRGVLALVEGDVGDLLEELGVASEIADMAPGDLVRGHLEVVVAERLEAGEPLVDFRLLREDGVHRLLLVGLRGRACHPRHPSASLGSLAWGHESLLAALSNNLTKSNNA